jgi:hypothetical protein
MTAIDYKGYRIEVSPIGKGWRASIFWRGSTRALADSPFNLEKSRTEEIVAEAKRIIDARPAPLFVLRNKEPLPLGHAAPRGSPKA